MRSRLSEFDASTCTVELKLDRYRELKLDRYRELKLDRYRELKLDRDRRASLGLLNISSMLKQKAVLSADA